MDRPRHSWADLGWASFYLNCINWEICMSILIIAIRVLKVWELINFWNLSTIFIFYFLLLFNVQFNPTFCVHSKRHVDGNNFSPQNCFCSTNFTANRARFVRITREQESERTRELKINRWGIFLCVCLLPTLSVSVGRSFLCFFRCFPHTHNVHNCNTNAWRVLVVFVFCFCHGIEIFSMKLMRPPKVQQPLTWREERFQCKSSLSFC